MFNPLEFVPEYVADVGVKKGEKVDYAVVENGKPTIIIEAKSCNEKLDGHHSQLFRYFAVTEAKFAILTNGLEYRFYSDLNKENIMDMTPFFTVDVWSLNDKTIEYLDKFAKGNLDVGNLMSTAKEFKYQGLIKENFKRLLEEPTDLFIKALLGDEVKTKKEASKYRALVKKTINLYINDMMSERFGETLNKSYSSIEEEVVEEVSDEVSGEDEYIDIDMGNGIITTADEQRGFDIVKSILSKYVDIDRITYKDSKTRFNILLDGSITKWICRFEFNSATFHVIIPYDKVIERQCRVKKDFALKSLDDLNTIEEELVASLKRYLDDSIKSIHIEEVSKEFYM